MIRKIAFFLGLMTVAVAGADAQDTLPKFSVVAKPLNRNVVSWTNNFLYTSQINIQRSPDSNKNFITIVTVPDPSVRQNGFVDNKVPSGNIFYRLFIVLDSGKYQFTGSKRPAPDTAKVVNEPILNDNQRLVLSDSLSNKEVKKLEEKLAAPVPAVPKPEKFFIIRKRDTLTSVSQKNFKKFKDSIIYSTRDTLIFVSIDTMQIRPFVPKEIYKTSKYVYTEKYGNVMIALPDAGRKKYSISFFEENKKQPLFEIKEVHSTALVVDKTNFVHSGWFWFELFENGTLKERHRFYLPKDF